MRTQQDRTIKGYNLNICDAYDCDESGWPMVRGTYTLPDGLASFEVASAAAHAGEFAHFFIDDYRFSRLWERPERYLDVLGKYAGVIAPDFSTYTDMPYPMQAWNKYRSMALERYWELQGIDVVPVIQFSDERSYKWAFDGLPKNSVLASSTVGVARDGEARRLFVAGMEEACRRLEPAGLVMYGSRVEFDARGAELYWYPNDNSERVKRNLAQRPKKET